MADLIVARIARALGVPDLAERLAALPGSDLQSLLLAVIRARAAAVTPAQLAAAATRGGTVAPSSVDARRFHALDGAAYAAAPDFEAVELAPVAPLGTDTRLGGISANNVLATVRASQLLADPTTALALEAARRRRAPANRAIDHRLCAAARVIRLQPLPPGEPDFTPHFRLFSMITAGRDTGSFSFEARALREQLAVYLRLVDALPALGIDVRAIEIAISDTDAMRAQLAAAGVPADELAGLIHGYDADAGAPTLAARGLRLPRALDPDRDLAAAAASPDPAIAGAARAARRRLAAADRDVIAPLARDFPRARFRLDGARLAGLGYYAGLTIQLWLETADGASLPVGDGGFTTWTRDLLNDRKERLLTSGLGVELLLKRYVRR
jgi:hypothetical protein